MGHLTKCTKRIIFESKYKFHKDKDKQQNSMIISEETHTFSTKTDYTPVSCLADNDLYRTALNTTCAQPTPLGRLLHTIFRREEHNTIVDMIEDKGH